MADKSLPHRKTVITKSCKQEFKARPDHSTQNCCSRACAGVLRRNRIERTCEYCNNNFTVIAMLGAQRCCSQEHWNLLAYPAKERKECAQCGKQLVLPPCRARRPNVTCGKTCHLKRIALRKVNNRAKYQAAALVRARERNLAARMTIINAYGGRCACCGEAQPLFLSIDHIHGDATRDRNAAGKKLGGSNLYRLLIQQGFPKDRYQLLCFNCNCSKGFFGACPHQTKRQATVKSPLV